MSRLFIAQALRPEQAAQAYPLLQSAFPALTLSRWTEFVRSQTRTNPKPAERAKGIMAIQSDRGYIHGLFSYSVAPDLQHGRVLLVDNFVAVDLVESDAAVQALRQAMEEVAARLDCQAIRLHAAVSGDGLGPVLSDKGQAFGGVRRWLESVCYCGDPLGAEQPSPRRGTVYPLRRRPT
jgi:hypothetical protein